MKFRRVWVSLSLSMALVGGATMGEVFASGGRAAGEIDVAHRKSVAATRTIDANRWFNQWKTWARAYEVAEGHMWRACKAKGSADCQARKDQLSGVIDGMRDFYERTVAMDPVPPRAAFNANVWISKVGFQKPLADANLPVAKWAEKVEVGALAYTKAQVARAGSIADKTARAGRGQCTVHTRPSKRHDLDGIMYLIRGKTPRVYVRCTAPRDLSAYPRDKKDYLAVTFYDGGLGSYQGSGWSANVAAIPKGRYVEFEVPVAAVQDAMKRKSNGAAGNVNHIKFLYIAANIQRYEETVVDGKLVQNPVWHLEEVASGSALMETP